MADAPEIASQRGETAPQAPQPRAGGVIGAVANTDTLSGFGPGEVPW